jgi:hypothetical protein
MDFTTRGMRAIRGDGEDQEAVAHGFSLQLSWWLLRLHRMIFYAGIAEPPRFFLLCGFGGFRTFTFW